LLSSSFSDAIIEQEMAMTGGNMFWLNTLHDCHLDRSLPLPYDRYRLSNEHRTDREISLSFDFGQDLSHHFLTYASSNNISIQDLVLTCYYAFLFKLTNGEKDLCIGMNTDGRYRDELKSVIGLFQNTIPLRCRLDPYWSLNELFKEVKEMMSNSLKYSYFPLQRILDQYPNILKPTFLYTSFVFYSNESQNVNNGIMIGDNRLYSMPTSIKINEDKIMNKFDFALIIEYIQRTNQLSFTINASVDLFNQTTIEIIAQRFHSNLVQLFNMTKIEMNKSIYELSLILSNERLLLQSMNNTEVLFPPLSCIHHQFISQTVKHPQKLAVELDDQSLTYSELLHNVQVLSLHLLNEQKIVPGDVICQCVERSLSMVSY
jgi:non-ribosomal peptide synthetase component F